MPAPRLISATDLLTSDISTCPLPSGLGWDSANYPVIPSIYDIGNNQRKGSSGYSIFSSTTYSNCRNGTQIYYSTTGNDSTGVGSSGNPYRTPSKCVQVANAGGAPATVLAKAGEFQRTTTGAISATLPTVPIAFVASGGIVTTGAYDKGYTWAADGTYAWVYSTARSSAYAVYDPSRRDRFGNFVMLVKVSSLAICSRIPGSWYTDNTSVWVHSYDESQPTDTTVRVYVTVAMGAFAFGSAPKDIFFDRETATDGWDLQGACLSFTATAYDSVDRLIGMRGVSAKYGPNGGTGVFLNNFSVENWRGLAWIEECYSARAASDSFNFHNTLNTQQLYAAVINCKAVDCGVFGTGSNNHLTAHENVKGISVGNDFDFAQGGTLRNINTSKWLSHGDRIRNDRGDGNVGGTLQPTEVQCDNTAEIWLSECLVEAANGGYAFNNSGAGLHLRNMARYKGKTLGTIDTWTS